MLLLTYRIYTILLLDILLRFAINELLNIEVSSWLCWDLAKLGICSLRLLITLLTCVLRTIFCIQNT